MKDTSSNIFGARMALVAGKFYELEETKLKLELDKLFNDSNKGIGLPDKGNLQKKVFGIIVPHAGLFFSGKCQAVGYSNFLDIRKNTTFIVIGPNHTGIGCSSISLKDFDTPLGLVKNDVLISKEIELAGICVNERAHSFEHSIEMQAIFLRYLSIRNGVELKIVPVILGSNEDGVLLSNRIDRLKDKEIVVVASSDFIHYGPDYNYTPQGSYERDIVSKHDSEAIDKIIGLDPKGFMDLVVRNRLTICGAYPIVSLLNYLNGIKQKLEPKLLCYYHSADVLPSKNSVSYASIGFFG